MMSAHKVAQIPELMDMTIDHLLFDSPALGACAAVCRAWLPSSRSRLFHSLELRPGDSKAFLALLDSPFATIAPYVRSLDIFESRKHSRYKKWVGNALPHLTCLVGVRSLWLSGVDWRNLRAEPRDALISSFKQVTQLALWYTTFDKFERLVDLLCSYPLLEHVRFGDVFWPCKNFLASSPKRLSPFFRHLDLGNCSKTHVIETLFPRDCMYAVNTVYLSFITLQEFRPIAAFLRNLGPNLHHLRINIKEVTESFCHILDLAHNNQLRSIRIGRVIRGNLNGGTTDVEQVAAIFSQIASRHIELVELLINLSGRLEIIDWSPLAKVFAQPQFAALRLIRIAVRGRKAQEVANTFRKGLPDCDARGILDFPVGLDLS